MIYTYIDEQTGEAVDLHKPSSKADPIGTVIEHEGRRLRRVWCGTIDTAGIARKTHGYPFASNSLPKRTKGCKHDHKGRPIITSQAHERSILAQEGYVRD